MKKGRGKKELPQEALHEFQLDVAIQELDYQIEDVEKAIAEQSAMAYDTTELQRKLERLHRSKSFLEKQKMQFLLLSFLKS